MVFQQYISTAKQVIKTEAEEVLALESRIDYKFVEAVEIILSCKGRVIVTGMGKSGQIGKKIAATLASTGTPAFFLHPGEASHGDLGMVTKNDIILAISNSGKTPEIQGLLPLFKRLNTPIIAMTGKENSELAKASDVILNTSVKVEACPLGLAPTSSTTVTLVMGDALAMTLLEARGFTEEQFAFSHPGGSLGRQLLLKVEDLMHTGEQVPKVNRTDSLGVALKEISKKGLGMTTIVDSNEELCGVFTDGDLRRIFHQQIDHDSASIQHLMSPNPKTINSNRLAAEALSIMETNKITALIVINNTRNPIGVIHMHDLLKAGVV